MFRYLLTLKLEYKLPGQHDKKKYFQREYDTNQWNYNNAPVNVIPQRDPVQPRALWHDLEHTQRTLTV